MNALRPEFSRHGMVDNPLEGLRAILRLARGALQRRWRLALTCLLGTLGLTLVALAATAPQYLVEARLLTNPGYLIPSLAHPTRSVPRESQSATRGAVELIKSRQSLLRLLDASELSRRWQQTRTPVGQVVDGLRSLLVGPLSPADLREALVNMVDQRLWASIDGDSIQLRFRWHDPESALLVVENTTDLFLAARRERELGEIDDTITILERSVAESQPALDRATAELESAIRAAGRSGRTVRAVRRERPASSAASRERELLEQELAGKRRRIQQLELGFQRALQRAQQDLQAVRTTLGPQHPDVAAALREVERRSLPSQELTGLRTEEVNLIHRLKGSPGHRAAPTEGQPATVADTGPLPLTDPAVERAMHAYRQAEAVHSDLQRRLSNAQMELSSARAAFGYRYIVTQPPIYPRRAVSPRPVRFLLGGLTVGLFLALLFAVLADLREGRVVEAWQLERLLDVRVLGELKEP